MSFMCLMILFISPVLGQSNKSGYRFHSAGAGFFLYGADIVKQPPLGNFFTFSERYKGHAFFKENYSTNNNRPVVSNNAGGAELFTDIRRNRTKSNFSILPDRIRPGISYIFTHNGWGLHSTGIYNYKYRTEKTNSNGTQTYTVDSLVQKSSILINWQSFLWFNLSLLKDFRISERFVLLGGIETGYGFSPMSATYLDNELRVRIIETPDTAGNGFYDNFRYYNDNLTFEIEYSSVRSRGIKFGLNLGFEYELTPPEAARPLFLVYSGRYGRNWLQADILGKYEASYFIHTLSFCIGLQKNQSKRQ